MEMNAAADLKPNVVPADTGLAIDTSGLNLWYGNFQALFDVNLQIKKGRVTSLIGPSGCGKSTFLRSINRINERLGYVTINGSINVFGNNIYAPEVELVQVRKQVGMVFQRPNPLPTSIRENILFGHKLHNRDRKYSRDDEDEIVEESLRQVLLWDKVAVYRPPAAGQTECAVNGRTLLCARSQGNCRGRGTDLGTARQVFDPDRDPQHGAGAARQRGMHLHVDG
jgi:ABC-type polar amino acid transport system ATPase subunit